MAFVTKSGTQLNLNGKEFQFASFNTPNLHVIEVPWQRIDAFEQENQLASLSQLGGQVTRTYTFSIPKVAQDTSRHIVVKQGFGTPQVQWELNEGLMQDLDRALAIASQYNIKVIIPFIDRWEWWGGVDSFAKLFGKTELSFYTDSEIRNQWKVLLGQIIERNNTVNGIVYKDDPTILAWEMGNELEYQSGRIPSEWILDTAATLKRLDQNHLIMDGTYGKYGWDKQVLESPLIDIFTNHYYPEPLSVGLYSPGELAGIFSLAFLFIAGIITIILVWKEKIKTKLKKKYAIGTLCLLTFAFFGGMAFLIVYRALVQNFTMRMENEFNLISSYNKAFILGEVGIAPVSVIKGTIDHYKQVGISGVLLWSLRGHSRLGGFYTHEEHSGYFSYHYPGFAESVGFGKDERDIMQMMINANRDTRNITRPAPPELLAPRNTTDAFQLRWKGSAGATHYSIEVTSPRIEVLFSSVTDNKPSGQTLLELPKELLRTKGLTSCSLRVNAHGEWGTLSSPSSSFTV